MSSIVQISQLSKTYESGTRALEPTSLDIKKGEIFALLGPNGAGKTTLISIICGITNPSSGTVTIDGYDIVKDYRKTRSKIGLVPQELSVMSFESVWTTVSYSRALFGKPRDDAYIEDLLKRLTLWDKKDQQIMRLSGGMKRRVLIAKALAHQPDILFLDEPTAGVDVELRRNMLEQIQELHRSGVTVILTTHYIEEAEQLAERVGIIDKGKLILVEEKSCLITKMGQKELHIQLAAGYASLPASLSEFNLQFDAKKRRLTFKYDVKDRDNGVSRLLSILKDEQIEFKDILTKQSSLEDIFVNLVKA